MIRASLALAVALVACVTSSALAQQNPLAEPKAGRHHTAEIGGNRTHEQNSNSPSRQAGPSQPEQSSSAQYRQTGAFQCTAGGGCTVSCAGGQTQQQIESIALFQSGTNILLNIYKHGVPVGSWLMASAACSFDGFVFTAVK
jgi:hypothetical protein